MKWAHHDAGADGPAQSESTERAAQEREIQALRAHIAELERARDAAEGFAAIAAHEVLTPLVLAEACVTLANERLDGHAAEDMLHALGVLGRAAGRTRLLVESLLHEARAGARPLRRETVDLAALAADCVALLEPEVSARAAGVRLGALPVVMGEAELLGGLLTNLLSNALKFSPADGAAVAVGSHRTRDGWNVFVDSAGEPLAESERARIFEPFLRGHGGRRVPGVGLGLAICSRIVERHGGTIGVITAADGTGNRFFFTLPD
jgi:signal transduction histidine kinase